VVALHNVILLAAGDIQRHTSMGLFPLLGTRVTNYPDTAILLMVFKHWSRVEQVVHAMSTEHCLNWLIS